MTEQQSEKQMITTFDGGYAQPNAKTALMLAEGVYSLSSRCNLPYVKFTGSGGFEKTISWGEVAVVPCGQTVTVRNASAHPGNLIINSGVDPYPMPASITVPTRVLSTGVEFGLAQTKYTLDVRRAKRAYLIMSGVGEVEITVIGRTIMSHDTDNLIAAPQKGSGYTQLHLVGAAIQIPPIPLGFKALPGDDTRPMALLDNVLVAFNQAFLTPVTAYFVAEYQ